MSAIAKKTEGIYSFNIESELNATALSQFNAFPVDNVFGEVSLSSFKPWALSCRFQTLVKDDIDLQSRFTYKCIFLAPIGTQEPTPPVMKKVHWARDVLRAFYASCFTPNPSDLQKIAVAVGHEWSVMIVGIKQKKGTNAAKSAYSHKGCFVIGAVTFTFYENDVDKEVAAFISWLAVAYETKDRPSSIDSWRHLGFGRFLLIQVIKRCMLHSLKRNAESPEAPPFVPGNVRLFLQSTQQHSFMFYTTSGFIVLCNNEKDDGYDKLPECITKNMPKEGDASPFIPFFPTDIHPAPVLLTLPPGNLREKPKTIIDLSEMDDSTVPELDDSSVSITTEPSSVMDLTKSPERATTKPLTPLERVCSWWCEYPLSSKGTSAKLVYRMNDFNKLLKNLHVLKTILPTNPLLGLLPADSMSNHGSITMARRQLHHKSNGRAYLSSDELDLFFAVLKRDTRFEEAHIVPVGCIQFITHAFECYQQLQLVMEYIKECEEKEMEEHLTAEAVYEKFGVYKEKVVDDYNKAMNKVLKVLLHPNLGLIHKKIIAFPNHEGGNHWTYTIIFNASSINKGIESENLLSPACWFHFDPMDANSHPSVKSGMNWFLNLALNYFSSQQSADSGNEIKPLPWETPFPMEINHGQVFGTSNFPRVVFHEDDARDFVKQSDAYNCGLGVCAAVSLIFQEFLVAKSSMNDYNVFFQSAFQKGSATDQKGEESVYTFPKCSISAFRQKLSIGEQDYLQVLRQELFLLFDGMAEYQHDLLPKRLIKKDHEVDASYTALLLEISKATVHEVHSAIKEETITTEEQTVIKTISDASVERDHTLSTTLSVVSNDSPPHKSESKSTSKSQEEAPNVSSKSTDIGESKNDPNPKEFSEATMKVLAKWTNPKTTKAPPKKVEARIPKVKRPATLVRPSGDGAVKPTPKASSATEGQLKPTPKPALTEEVQLKPTPEPAPSDEGKLKPTPEPAPSDEGKLKPTPTPAPTHEGQLKTTPKRASSEKKQLKPTPKPAPTATEQVKPTPKLAPTATEQVKPTPKVASSDDDDWNPVDSSSDKESEQKPTPKTKTRLRKVKPNQAAKKANVKKVSGKRKRIVIDDDDEEVPPVIAETDDEDNEYQPWKTFFKNTTLTPAEIAENEAIERQHLNAFERKKNLVRYKDTDYSIWNEFLDMPLENVVEPPPPPPNTLTKESLETFIEKYQEEQLSPDQVELLNGEEMNAFVENSFKKWNWSSEKVHKRNVEAINDLINNEAETELKREGFRLFQKAIKAERARFRQSLEDEYRFSVPAFTKGVQYVRSKNEFRALMVYKAPDVTGEVTVQKKTIVVPWEWMTTYYEPDAIEFIMNLDTENMFVKAPPPESEICRLNEQPVIRVRYVREQKKKCIDLQKLGEMVKEEEVKNAKIKRERLRSLDQINKVVTEEEKEKPKRPKREVTQPAHWKAKYASGQTKTIAEEEVVELFGQKFVDQVKNCQRGGFIDVPVGDFKVSHLFKYPELIKTGAPRLRYTQADGQDLCVSKALASVLHHLGFEESAFEIDKFGCEHLSGGAMSVLDTVRKVAMAALPNWICSRAMPNYYHWLSLPADQILLAVLLDSDGLNSHAVCIHGGWIFDANETVAIPLCQQALDYCTSNAEQQCRFVRFWKGYLFLYEGKGKEKSAQMRGP